ncbi:hypothetical protein D3C73_1579970 [compost metagenome]
MNRQTPASVRPSVNASEAIRRSSWNRFSTNSPSRMNHFGRSSTREHWAAHSDKSPNFRLSSRPDNSSCGQRWVTTS